MEDITPRKFCLGATSGLVAAGAWAARLEVARLLESGCHPDHLLSLIRRGEEGSTPLRLDWDAREWSECLDKDSDQRSTASRPAHGPSDDRSRSPLRSAGEPGEAEEFKEVGDLFEGEKMEDVIAEQAAILSEIAKSKDDPPWLAPKSSRSGGPSIGGKSSGATVLQMATTEPTFSKVAPPPPSDFKTAGPRPFKRQPDTPAAGEELPDFKRKAAPPPQGVLPEPVKVPQRPPPPRPGTGTSANSLEAREKEDLDRFARAAVEIYEGLEVVGIHMDLKKYVRTSKGIDKEKFLLHTAPNRASTGLRYVRVMKGIVEWVETFDPIPEEESVPPLERLRLVEYIELLIQKGVGYNTPQTLLFAIDFFSKSFGFDPTGSEWNRAKRLSVKYKKSKPGLANRAPLFGKVTLAALEKIVLDDLASTPHRIAAGKLRLCCQASIRYDDLVHTPLRHLEWVRRRGGTRVVGLRARTTQGKNKARPWVASLMATCRSRDGWLSTLVDLVLMTHGMCWLEDDHFGKEVTRDGEGFTRLPARLETDVYVVKEALRQFQRTGGDPGMTDRELDLLRWHGGKATLTTLMQHLELDPKMIRLAGDWSAKEDTMPDTYLREAQLMVLKGQESCMAYLRAGGDFGGLVSSGLVGGAPPPGDGEVPCPADSHGGGAEEHGVKPESAESKKLAELARQAGFLSEYQGVAGKDLNSSLFDRGLDKKGEPVDEVVGEERERGAIPEEKWADLLESNNPDDDVYVVYNFDMNPPAVKSEPTDAEESKATGVEELSEGLMDAARLEDDDNDLESHTLRFVMLDKPTASSRLHLPFVGASSESSALLVPTPRCGAKGNYSFLGAAEALDQSTELCLRCFGRRSEGACNRLCGVKLRMGDDVYRCARRCSTSCTDSGVHLCHVHGF